MNAPAAYPPLPGSTRLAGTLAVSMATFMNVLDSTIANVSISAIAGDLGVSPYQGTWVITSFSVANAISVPLTGWLTQRFGQVRLFVTSVLMFTLASWLCGLAPSIGALIACRVLQGLVAGPMMPLSQTLILASYPPEKAGQAMALWSMTVLVAPIVGPILGGWITDHIAWPWIFYINVPIGLCAAAATWAIYRHRDPGPRRVPLDWLGLVLLVLFVGALQAMLDLGKEHDWFSSWVIVGLALAAALGFVYFLAWELTHPFPVVNLRLFATRNFAVGSTVSAVSYGLFFGNVVLLPLWLQQHMGYTATWAGLALAPAGLVGLVLSPWVGRHVQRLEPRLLASVAFLLFGLVMWLRSLGTVHMDFAAVAGPTFLQGVAVAFFFIPLQAVVFAGLPHHLMPAAAGLTTFMRSMAAAVGTSLFATLWEARAQMYHARLVESLTPQHPQAAQMLEQLQQQGLSAVQALQALDRMANQQAYTLAVNDLFLLSSALFGVLVLAVWLTEPRRAAAAAAH